MGRVKIKRKSTLIDMTAMSDVTVLLLTFFMLTSTFLQKEPVIVNTPSSVSELKVPTSDLITVLVDQERRVFISIAGSQDSTYSSEYVRARVLEEAAKLYNGSHKNKINFTQKQVNTFKKINMFGYPLASLGEFLDQPQAKQDELVDPSKNKNAGIPVDDNKDLTTPNEFQIWMKAIYNVSGEVPATKNANGDTFENLIKRGEGIALKADKETPYEVVHTVMDNLQTLKMNKFSLLTALKSEEQE